MKAVIRKPDGSVEHIALLAEDFDGATRECVGLEEECLNPDEEIIAIVE